MKIFNNIKRMFLNLQEIKRKSDAAKNIHDIVDNKITIIWGDWCIYL